MSPKVHPQTPRVALACSCQLGEEAIWDARSGMLQFVDIEDPAIWRFWPESGRHERYALSEKLGFALLTSDPDIVVAGLKSGVVRLRLSDGSREALVAPDPHPAGNRLNSGNIGPDGALYFGSMHDAEEHATGSYHRWDGHRLQTFGGQAAVTNGPIVSPDGSRVYTIATSEGLIREHVLRDGAIGEGVPLIAFEPDWGHPDGVTLDAEGHLWVCHYDGARITRFTPTGEIERVLPLPTPYVTKCAFGGSDLTTLYITTARRGLDPQIDPVAGHLFVVETNIRGFASNLFTLPIKGE